jgi:hypothetical protein
MQADLWKKVEELFQAVQAQAPEKRGLSGEGLSERPSDSRRQMRSKLARLKSYT